MQNSDSRIEYFERMLESNPHSAMGLLALANEYNKAGRRGDEADVLGRYVEIHDDEGNAYFRLGDALAALGRTGEAGSAYERGISQAERFGHEGMATDLREARAGLGE